MDAFVEHDRMSKCFDAKTDVPESFDAGQLKHLSKDEMVMYFNVMMTMMKRSHDSAMQEQAEKYYSLKREYLNLRDDVSSLPLKKDKEFDILKKKIPEVILKLDDILVENENLPAFGDIAESLGNLKDRLDSLLSENRQLRDSLTDKKNEVKCLSSKVSDAEGKFEELYRDYLIEYISRVSLERKALEIVNELRSEVTEKEGLKQELLLLEMSMKEKEKCVSELSATLLKQGEQLELASQELNSLRAYASQQQATISESNKELDLLKRQLEEALKQNEVDKVEIDKLNQKLEQAMEELKEANEQKKVVLALTQEKQSILFLVEAKEKEHKKQMETVNVLVHGLSKMIADFECRVAEDIRKSNTRLQHLKSELSSLIRQACLVRSTGLMYKQRLERRCSELQMAEAEVDLLEDEVDTLLSRSTTSTTSCRRKKDNHGLTLPSTLNVLVESSKKKYFDYKASMATTSCGDSEAITHNDDLLEKCVDALNSLEDIDAASYTKAIKIFGDGISYRKMFLSMPDHRKKDFVIHL